MMTIEQFRATRRRVENLGEALECDDFEEPGIVYIDKLYIRKLADGRLWLQLYNFEVIEPDTDAGIALLESMLFDFAESEGYLDEPEASDEERSEGPRHD